VTATPRHVGECPEQNADLVPDFSAAFKEVTNPDLVTPVLDFLNQGGPPRAVVQAFEQADQPIFEGDLTNDDVLELGCSIHSFTLSDAAMESMRSSSSLRLNGITGGVRLHLLRI